MEEEDTTTTWSLPSPDNSSRRKGSTRYAYWALVVANILVLRQILFPFGRQQQFLLWDSTTTSTSTSTISSSFSTTSTSWDTKKCSSTSSFLSLQQSTTPSFPLPHKSQDDIIFIVLSRRDAWEQRQVIRETWASQHASKVYFVVGQPCTIPPLYRDVDEGGNEICLVAPMVLPKRYRDLVLQQMELEDKVSNQLLEEQKKHSDLLMMDQIDMYRSLPAKVKYGYRFVHEFLPKADWVVKLDDDFYVRIDAFEKHLRKAFGPPSNDPKKEGLVVGGEMRVDLYAATQGKWKEVPQWEFGGAYPTFPLGSYGHAVSRPIVDYVAQMHDALFDFQGEDVSLGIWLDHPNAPNTLFMQTSRMQNHGGCDNPEGYVIGHDISTEAMRRCWSKDRSSKL